MLILGYILLFILCLSTLIMVHEAGHLATAKMFKVFCFEYSVGFGPKIFKVRRKGGETYFSLRAIPFGGYVSMYGENDVVPEGFENIDSKRSLESIKKWKKIIIMAAGVIMNMVLAIVIFFIYEIGFPKYIGYSSRINVAPGSLAEEAGLHSNDLVYNYTVYTDTGVYVLYDCDATMTYYKENEEPEDVYAFFGYNFSTLTLKDASLFNHAVAFAQTSKGNPDPDIIGADIKTVNQIRNGDYTEDIDYCVTGFIKGYGTIEVGEGENKENILGLQIVDNFVDKNDQSILIGLDNYKDYKEDFDSLGVGLKVTIYGKVSDYNDDFKILNAVDQNYDFNVPVFNNLFDKKNTINDFYPTSITYSLYNNVANNSGKGYKCTLNQNIQKLDSCFKLEKDPGLSMKIGEYHSSYGDAVKNCFVDFADAATLIGRGLGQLFTNAESWQNVGGIIAVGVMTTRTLEENGFGAFLNMWAVISVNLAIVNLLPFPGLDGWHILVTVVEGVTRKELPKKFKTIMSLIGIVILFALMIAIVIKDVIAFI